MTLDEMIAQRGALPRREFGGVRTVEIGRRRSTYAKDVEMTAPSRISSAKLNRSEMKSVERARTVCDGSISWSPISAS